MTSFTRFSSLGLSLVVALGGCTTESTRVPPPVPKVMIDVPSLREESMAMFERTNLAGPPLKHVAEPIVLRAHKRKNVPEDITSQISYKMSVIRELLTLIQPLSLKLRYNEPNPNYANADIAIEQGVANMNKIHKTKMKLVNVTKTLRNSIRSLLKYSNMQVRKVRIASYGNPNLNIEDSDGHDQLLAIAGLSVDEYTVLQELIPQLSRADKATTILWHAAAQHRFNDLRKIWPTVLMACAPLPGCKGLDALGHKIDKELHATKRTQAPEQPKKQTTDKKEDKNEDTESKKDKENIEDKDADTAEDVDDVAEDTDDAAEEENNNTEDNDDGWGTAE